MDTEECRTPQKLVTCQTSTQQSYLSYEKSASPAFKFISQQLQKSSGYCFKSKLKRRLSNEPDQLATTPNSKPRRNGSYSTKSFHVFPIVNTPPSLKKINRKVVNPFEAGLSERLHLPLICSPSLFQRPITPQHSSTLFEWSIEEISSMGPANVEPHETQFQDSLDPDSEAKTQAAISSYFKDQEIVPSPVDCPLRNRRINLGAAESNDFISPNVIRPPKRIRDGSAQTVLTLPPILPKEIEETLRPFFKYIENQQQSPSISKENNFSLLEYHETRDASLRRKLFGFPSLELDDTVDVTNDDDAFQIGEFSPPPKSPEIGGETPVISSQKSNSCSLNQSSFGSLSPISKTDSPQLNRFSSKNKILDNSISEQISPILSPSETFSLILSPSETLHTSEKVNSLKSVESLSYREVEQSIINTSLYRSTPDNNSILCGKKRSYIQENTTIVDNNNMSVNSSLNNRVSRLIVNSCKPAIELGVIQKTRSLTEVDIFEQCYDEDEMQVSQLSAKSTNSSISSHHTDTPRRSKRVASRKNLSRSFSRHYSDDDNDDDDIENLPFENDCSYEQSPIIKRRSLNQSNDITIFEPITGNVLESIEKSTFYRTDSGFNEMTNTQDDTKFGQMVKLSNIAKENENSILKVSDDYLSMNEDVNMMRCSTPSKGTSFY